MRAGAFPRMRNGARESALNRGIPNGKFRVYDYRWKGDELVPVPEEAAIVKRIFQNFLDGKSRLDTEKEFAAEGIKTRNGRLLGTRTLEVHN